MNHSARKAGSHIIQDGQPFVNVPLWIQFDTYRCMACNGEYRALSTNQLLSNVIRVLDES